MDSVTLTCNITRANPIPDTFTWTNVNNAATLSETSNSLMLSSISTAEIATYRCEARTVAGTGMDTITIELGGQAHAQIPYVIHLFLSMQFSLI